jgi:hypothetical protein
MDLPNLQPVQLRDLFRLCVQGAALRQVGHHNLEGNAGVRADFQSGICFEGAKGINAWLGPGLVVQGGTLFPAAGTGARLGMAAAARARVAVHPLQHGVLCHAVLGGLLNLLVSWSACPVLSAGPARRAAQC